MLSNKMFFFPLCSRRTSLYRGWFPVISSLCCSNFVYFYTFNSLKRLMVLGKGQSTPGKDLVMGFIAGRQTPHVFFCLSGPESPRRPVTSNYLACFIIISTQLAMSFKMSVLLHAAVSSLSRNTLIRSLMS